MKATELLEYSKIKDILQTYASSGMGKQAVEGLSPCYQLEKAREQLQETTEALGYLYHLGYHPVPSFPDVGETFARARLAAALSPGELLQFGKVFQAVKAVKKAIPEGNGRVFGYMASLVSFDEIGRKIQDSILSPEEIADGASPQLNDIRRRIRRGNERVREKLQDMIHSPSYAKYLQEPIITMRNDRFVIPVKQECRQNVSGMLHDQSASGQTLFIEPMAVVEINNELKQLLLMERDEIERILTTLTAMLAPHIDEIKQNLAILAKLDVIFAKASLAKKINGAEPQLNGEGMIELKAACHPLIPKDTVVPIDISLGQSYHCIIVTGPNTGGKTVTLKTVGLLTLMALSGLYLPAVSAKICVFENVFADIGDEQSIEQSLSTFSSHMTNIVSILREANEKSLVLLDELGAGTDPAEGAALAMAILDKLMEKKCSIMATTHYSEIKAYALTKKGVINASMEFDLATLRPTYKITLGLPGRSNAFEIALRLGVEQAVVHQAREYLSGETVRFDEVISTAQQHSQQAKRDREEAQRIRMELQRMKEQMEKSVFEAQQKEKEILEKSRKDARDIIQRAKSVSEDTIRELRELEKQDQKTREKGIQRARDTIKEAAVEVEPDLKARSYDEPPGNLKPGDTVHVLSVDAVGSVLSSSDQKKDAVVQVGIIKMTLPYDDLRITSKPEEQHRISKREFSLGEKQVAGEIHLRGQALDEAMLNLSQYLDDAYVYGYKEIRIVHGKGTGILRSGVHDLLKKDDRIKTFRLGKYGEGEQGVTVVEFK
ncbi:MAG: endonuclease MutS2 [Christensenellales bacterium]